MIRASTICAVALALVCVSCEKNSEDSDSGASRASPVEGSGSSRRGSEPSAKASKLALLVGINEYRRGDEISDFNDLQGCVGDVERFRRVLVGSRFGFAPDDIVVLTDERATHANIVRAFREHLIGRAHAETEVVFFFSGHGSRLPDANPGQKGELDGTDSTLVAYDSRVPGRNAYDITDDELHSLLAVLCKKTERVTVITDACHSGGVTRGSRDSKKTAPEGRDALRFAAIESIWPEDVPFLDDLDARRSKLPYVHLAACLEDQEAEEQWFDDLEGERFKAGLLTWFLCEELERMEEGTTYQQLIQRVARKLATRTASSLQEPVYEGPVTREVFGGDFGAPLEGFEVKFIEKRRDKYARVAAGTLHGLNVGAKLEVRTDRGEKVGDVRLRDVRLHFSYGDWIGRPSLAANSVTNLRGVVRDLGDAAPPIVVHVPTGAFEDALATSLAKSKNPPIRVVRGDAAFQYAIRRVDGGAVRLFLGENFGLGDAVPVDKEGDVEAVRVALLERLANEAGYLSLMRLAEQRGNVPFEFTIEPVPEEDLAQFDIADIAPIRFIEANTRGAGSSTAATRIVEDRPEITDAAVLKVRVPRNVERDDLYLWIFSITENRAIQAIYPDSEANVGDNRIRPGGEKSQDLEIVLPRDGSWRADRPMRDRYIALLTTTRLGLDGLCRDGTIVERTKAIRDGIDDPATTRGDGDPPLPKVLELMLTGTTTRGESLRRSKRETFGVASIDLLVQRGK